MKTSYVDTPWLSLSGNLPDALTPSPRSFSLPPPVACNASLLRRPPVPPGVLLARSLVWSKVNGIHGTDDGNVSASFLVPSFLPSSLTCLLSSQYLSISPRIGENNSCRVRISVESGWTWELKQGNETKCNEMNVYLHLPRYVGAPNTTKLISSKPVYLDLYRAQKKSLYMVW